MLLGHEHEEYMKRLESVQSAEQVERRSRSRPVTPLKGMVEADRAWLSSGSLADWELEDKWWMSASCKSFLETKGTSFGRKNVYLIQKKDSLASNPELSRRPSSKRSPRKSRTSRPSVTKDSRPPLPINVKLP